VPTRAVVPGDDFASAFADLGAIEPVASRPSVVLDPRREFFLSCRVLKDGLCTHTTLVSSAFTGSCHV
jgi:hypothetical protein